LSYTEPLVWCKKNHYTKAKKPKTKQERNQTISGKYFNCIELHTFYITAVA